MSEHLSDLTLDALRLGDPLHEARAHLEGCAACRARSDALAREAQAFAQRFEVVGLAAAALATQQPSRARWWSRPMWIPALTALAVGAVIALSLKEPALRAKGGGAELEVYLLNGSERRLLDGPVDPHARLAVHLSPPGPRWVRLLWSTAADRWSALAPEPSAPASRLNGPSWFERELVLDGSREPERLGLVVCEAPLDHDEALRMLSGSVRQDCTIHTVGIDKR